MVEGALFPLTNYTVLSIVLFIPAQAPDVAAEAADRTGSWDTHLLDTHAPMFYCVPTSPFLGYQ